MEINEFLAIGVVGVLLSGAVEIIQAKYGFSSLKTKFTAIGLSLALGAFYVLFRDTSWWMTFLTILGASSTAYALIFKDTLSEHEEV